MDSKNYIKIYSQALDGLVWDKNLYEIHHIDFNRNNNNFNNLVLLPKKLHHQFHFFFNASDFSQKANLDTSLYSVDMTARFFLAKKDVIKMYKRLFNLTYVWRSKKC